MVEFAIRIPAERCVCRKSQQPSSKQNWKEVPQGWNPFAQKRFRQELKIYIYRHRELELTAACFVPIIVCTSILRCAKHGAPERYEQSRAVMWWPHGLHGWRQNIYL